MKFLNTIASALASKTVPLTAAKIAELITEAERGVETARSRLADLEGKRQEFALASDAERKRHREAINSARDDLADGEAAIEALRAKHTEAIAAEAEAGRKSRYDAAKGAAADLAKLVGDYERQARAVRDTIRKIAEIDTGVTAVNVDLPSGANPIPNSSNLRSLPSLPREVVSEKEVTLWCRPGSRDPLAPEYQSQVAQDRNGAGYLQLPNSSPLYLEKRQFARRELREATGGVHPTPLGQLNLPAARANEPPIFAPLRGASPYSPSAIVAAIDESATAEKAQRPKAERPVIVEHVAQ